MPTITFSHKDLNKLVGKNIPIKKLEDEAILYVKGEVENIEGDEIKVEVAETNRPELWSAEGIAREIRSQYSIDKGGIPKYKVKPAKLKVIIDPGLKNIRPHTVCAVVRKVKVTEQTLLQLIQLQEKICDTFGKKREQVAIGVYDFNKIKGPIHYKAIHPDKLKFIPLEFTSEFTLRQILDKHPKGKEYKHLLEGKEKYPVFIDANNEVLSMPPIINSNHTGRVTEETEDLFVECSGFDHRYLVPALNALVSALAERGGTIEAVKVVHGKKTITTPNLKPEKIVVKHSEIEELAGIKFKKTDVLKLLKKARYDVVAKGNNYVCEYPAYRADIMHPVDVIEDILISYGYNNIEPQIPKISFEGTVRTIETQGRRAAEILVGAGAQEIMNYTLTNKEDLFLKMNKKEEKVIEISNPVSNNWSVFRTEIVPQIIDFFSKNGKTEYPQQVFEVGKVVLPNNKEETKSKDYIHVAWGYAGKEADFTKSKQVLELLGRELGKEIKVKSNNYQEFIEGRSGEIQYKGKKIGKIGEIKPEVLQNHGLLVPICCFELNLSQLIE